MIYVSKEKWDKIPKDYKGEWLDFDGDKPEWKGRLTVMSGCISENIGSLMIEGVHFEIYTGKDLLVAREHEGDISQPEIISFDDFTMDINFQIGEDILFAEDYQIYADETENPVSFKKACEVEARRLIDTVLDNGVVTLMGDTYYLYNPAKNNYMENIFLTKFLNTTEDRDGFILNLAEDMKKMLCDNEDALLYPELMKYITIDSDSSDESYADEKANVLIFPNESELYEEDLALCYQKSPTGELMLACEESIENFFKAVFNINLSSFEGDICNELVSLEIDGIKAAYYIETDCDGNYESVYVTFNC